MRLHLELIANIQTEIICKNTEMLFTAYSVSYTDLGNLTIHFYIWFILHSACFHWNPLPQTFHVGIITFYVSVSHCISVIVWPYWVMVGMQELAYMCVFDHYEPVN